MQKSAGIQWKSLHPHARSAAFCLRRSPQKVPNSFQDRSKEENFSYEIGERTHILSSYKRNSPIIFIELLISASHESLMNGGKAGVHMAFYQVVGDRVSLRGD